MPKHKEDDQVFWTPTPDHIRSSNLSAFVRLLNSKYDAKIPLGDQNTLHAWTVRNTRLFWLCVAGYLSFPLQPAPTVQNVLTSANDAHLPFLVNVSWFTGSTTNIASVVLRHATISPSAPAIVFRPESASDDEVHRSSLTYAELQIRVTRLANALRAAGVQKGDTVAALLPSNMHCVIALLATAAVGAVWSCCSPDFGAQAVTSRLAQTRPKVLFCALAYIFKGRVHDIASNVESVCQGLPSLCYLVSVPDSRTYGRHVNVQCAHFSLSEFEHRFSNMQMLKFEQITMREPVVTMFSSGTTGKPKCIVQGAGIFLNQMKEHALHLEVSPASKIFFNTSTGWMLFNWLVAALGLGATIVLYDGAPFPSGDPMRLIRLCVEENVTHFGCGAPYVLLLKKSLARVSRTERLLGTSANALQIVLVTGSPSTIEHFHFVHSFFPHTVQCVNMSGGTDINGCFALGTPWKAVRAAQLQCAGLGMDVAVLDAEGNAVVEKTGELVCRNACPCMPLYFGHDAGHAKYRRAYLEKFGEHVWSHGDFATQTALGAFIISGRSDATLNPGGIRIGTADLYEIVESLPFVNDALVTEVQLENGELNMVLFIVMKDSMSLHLDEDKREAIRVEIRKRLSPRHVPAVILQVGDVPYTFSGKKCEIPVKNMLSGKEVSNKEAVKNPKAFESILVAVENSDGLQIRTSCPRKQFRRSNL